MASTCAMYCEATPAPAVGTANASPNDKKKKDSVPKIATKGEIVMAALTAGKRCEVSVEDQRSFLKELKEFNKKYIITREDQRKMEGDEGVTFTDEEYEEGGLEFEGEDDTVGLEERAEAIVNFMVVKVNGLLGKCYKLCNADEFLLQERNVIERARVIQFYYKELCEKLILGVAGRFLADFGLKGARKEMELGVLRTSQFCIAIVSLIYGGMARKVRMVVNARMVVYMIVTQVMNQLPLVDGGLDTQYQNAPSFEQEVDEMNESDPSVIAASTNSYLKRRFNGGDEGKAMMEEEEEPLIDEDEESKRKRGMRRQRENFVSRELTLLDETFEAAYEAGYCKDDEFDEIRNGTSTSTQGVRLESVANADEDAIAVEPPMKKSKNTPVAIINDVIEIDE